MLDLLVVTSGDLSIGESEGSTLFNVGVTLRLEDFLPEEVEAMNARHPRPLDKTDIARLHKLVAGQPSLTRTALYLTASDTPLLPIGELFARATHDSGPFADHLRYCFLRLQQRGLSEAFRQVIDHEPVRDKTVLYQLEAEGLIKREGAQLVPRCDLYARYFQERLR